MFSGVVVGETGGFCMEREWEKRLVEEGLDS